MSFRAGCNFQFPPMDEPIIRIMEAGKGGTCMLAWIQIIFYQRNATIQTEATEAMEERGRNRSEFLKQPNDK